MWLVQSCSKGFESSVDKNERVTASTILEKLMWLALGYGDLSRKLKFLY